MSKILIVDDEPDIRETLEVMLSKQNHQILLAGSGKEGLQAALAEKPDIILLDVMMPEMNGFETCTRLKNTALTKNIPVLLITALNDTDSKVKGLDAGADDFIAKPFNDSELRARIRAFLRTKSLRDELEENYKRLKELEEMKDLLIHTMVHDLKTPLTSVKGALSLLMDQIEAKEPIEAEHERLLRNALQSSNKILNLIQDILDVGRLEEKRLPVLKKPMDMKKLAEECLETIEPLAIRNEIKIEKRFPDVFPTVISDEEIIRRVLINILGNSLKFTEGHGKILLELNARPDENQLECVVQDTGMGIPPENLEKIFDKFFQGSNPVLSRRGQGLGLAFCRLAIESLGGKIKAESEEGKGSRFIIRLPLS